MTNDTESQALLAIAARQDAQSLKEAQTAARARLRAEGKAKRRELTAALKEERLALRAAAKKRKEQFEDDIAQVSRDLAIAVEQSDREIRERFQQGRRTQLENGVLGLAIAQRDIQP